MIRIIRRPVRATTAPATPPRRIIRSAAPKIARRVLGIDPSLASTGYAYRDGTGKVVTGTISTKGLKGAARLAHAARAVSKIIVQFAPDLVVYEDYAMGVGKGGMSFSIGELGGVLKLLFWESKIDVMLVAPSALKKSITGRGDADKARKINGKKVKDASKPEMRAALLNTFKLDLRQNDEADACGLMLMGEMRFGSSTVALAVQRKLRLDTLSDCVIMKGRDNV